MAAKLPADLFAAELQADLVVDVVSHLPLSTLASARESCRAWFAATQDDRLWQAVLHRQWEVTSQASLGRVFRGGWRDMCKAFCCPAHSAKGQESVSVIAEIESSTPVEDVDQPAASWSAKLGDAELRALHGMSPQAQRFLHGVAHSFMPTSDGCFTYHCQGATPIHYRHTIDTELPCLSEGCRLLVGGSWNWSPCRNYWFATESTMISQGRFAQDGWRLVEDNEKIVRFLEAFPIIPFFRSSIPVRGGAMVRCHAESNRCAIEDFKKAIIMLPHRSSIPSLACISSNLYTVHLHFLPALQLQCTERGWEVAPQTSKLVLSGQVDEFQWLVDALRAEINLSRYIRISNMWVREQLGLV